MVIFPIILCKIVPLQHNSVRTLSIPMDPKFSLIRGQYCLFEPAHEWSILITYVKNMGESSKYRKS